MLVVMMGVSGSGKTTIGTALAVRLGVRFADADDYHSAANKAKMAAGHPLDDADRAPWLAVLNELLREWYAEGAGGVLACSALKSSYRETLDAGLPGGAVQFVLLEASQALLEHRLRTRQHAYMNPVLLGSQLRTLEAPETTTRVSNDRPISEVVAEIVGRLGLG